MALTAADLMQTEVLTATPDMAVGELVRRLLRAHVSGAPVLGPGRRVVGVVSLTDVAEALEAEGAADEARRGERRPAHYYQHGSESGSVLLRRGGASLLERPVADIMTPYVIDVAPDTPVERVCRRMCDMHLHRVLVTERDRLLGVISSLDVLAAVADGRLRAAG